ncbi:MAG: glycosyltransferase family 4 protein [Bacteroidetes bacterium]|nr:glycosyltransferase family 4 protein [Bacteroidota bacterium]
MVYSLGGKLSNLLREEGISSNKIKQIPIGLEPAWISDKVHASGPVRRFVFIGRYERRKGIEELNKVLKQLIGKEKFEFHFIGPIPTKKRIQSDQLIYHGSIIDQSEIQKIVRSCDILISPSFAEGMPTVILEAMASALAVIATDVGAVSELVSDKTGWLVTAPKTKLIKAAILAALKVDAKELQNMKEKSRELVKKHYLWDEIIAKTISSIQETIKQV